MNNKIFPFILSMMFLVACDNSVISDMGSTENTVAIVNGQHISQTALTAIENEIAQRSEGISYPKEKLISELVKQELLVQEAVQKKLDQSSEFLEQLDSIKKSLLSQATIRNYLKSNPVTDADLEAEYKKEQLKSGTEYNARHILLETEKEAKQLIRQLDKGADFIKLAKSKSTGPSAKDGGSLGWFTASQMVSSFAEATVALKDGKYSTKPVESQFGWHIILREGSREKSPPAFETVKEKMRSIAQHQKIQAFIDNLYTQAKIEILLPTPEEQKKLATEPEKDSPSTDTMMTEQAGETTSKTMDNVAQ